MIEGVKVKKLKVIPDDRGRLMEILRKDDDIFQQFGQVYMTTAFPGVVKAWHYHKKQTDNFTCISGKMRLGLYDGRKDSPTFGKVEEYVISLEDPMAEVLIKSDIKEGDTINVGFSKKKEEITIKVMHTEESTSEIEKYNKE